MSIPGIEWTAGWRAFAELDEHEWIARVEPWVAALRAVDAAALAREARLPLGEVVASPFGLRAVALGVQAGSTSVDRETRTLIDGPGTENTADDEHGVWAAGRLHVGKYQAFMADAPFATYDPAHVAKWGPHELMHRAAGFFWRADASRFEHYLGARLNELLPVALWYGPDQVLRLRDDEEGFVRSRAEREAAVEDAAWWAGDFDALRSTLRWLRVGFEHVAGELAVIDQEIASGRLVPSPRHRGGAVLDASSDAAAYVVGHHERLGEPAVAAVLAEVPEGVCFDTITAYRAHVEQVWDALLFGPIVLDDVAARREARVQWDHDLRAAMGATDDAIVGDGHTGFDLGQLHDGVLSVAPVSADLAEARDPDWLDDFTESGAFRARAPLGERLRRFWAERDPLLADLVHFEHLLATATGGARHHLEGDGDTLVRNDAFALHAFDHDVVALHAGVDPGGPARVLVGRIDDDVSVIPLEPAVADLWRRLADTDLPTADVDAAIGPDWLATPPDTQALLPR